ncbi:MAG: formyltransferase, partial [Pseudomonadota bacterium]
AGRPARVLRTRVLAECAPRPGGPGIYAEGGRLVADCGRGVLQVLRLEVDGAPVDAAAFAARFGRGKIPFE